MMQTNIAMYSYTITANVWYITWTSIHEHTTCTCDQMERMEVRINNAVQQKTTERYVQSRTLLWSVFGGNIQQVFWNRCNVTENNTLRMWATFAALVTVGQTHIRCTQQLRTVAEEISISQDCRVKELCRLCMFKITVTVLTYRPVTIESYDSFEATMAMRSQRMSFSRSRMATRVFTEAWPPTQHGDGRWSLLVTTRCGTVSRALDARLTTCAALEFLTSPLVVCLKLIKLNYIYMNLKLDKLCITTFTGVYHIYVSDIFTFHVHETRPTLYVLLQYKLLIVSYVKVQWFGTEFLLPSNKKAT